MPINRAAVASLAIAIGVPLFGSVVGTQQANAQTTYTLKATPKTVAWGDYDAES